jgi:hypothetical protein
MELVCDLGDDFGVDCSWNPNLIPGRLGLRLQLGLATFVAPLHFHVALYMDGNIRGTMEKISPSLSSP